MTVSTFDGANRQIRVTDALGNTVESTFDGNGNTIHITSTQLCTITTPSDIAPEIFESAMRYDALNRLIVAAEPAADGTLNADLSNTSTRFTLRGFDSRGNATVLIDPKGNTSLSEFDGASRSILSVQHLRQNGQGGNGPLDGSTFLPDGGASIIVTTVYDGNGRVTRLIDDRGGVTTYEYDTLDRQIKLIYNDGSTLTNEYDEASDVTRFTDANGSIFDAVFDPLGRKTSVIITRGAGVIGTAQQYFEYDGLSRATYTSDLAFLGSVARFVYDSLGRTIQEIQSVAGPTYPLTFNQWTSWVPTSMLYPDAGSEVLTFGYDALYRRNDIQYDTTPVNVAHWEFFGPRVAEIQLANGLTCSMMNNARTRSAQQAGQATPGWGDQSSDRLGYDGGGRMTTKRYVSSTLNGGGGYSDPSSIVGFNTEYDLASNKLYERHLQAESHSHLYEPYALVNSVYVPQGGYDSVNRLLQYQRGVLDGTVGLNGQGGGAVATPITLPNTDVNRTYVLDGLGNWKKTTFTPEGGSLTTQNRQHNLLNEITRTKQGATVENFSYDANGNLLSDGVQSYQYDAFNRLVTAITIATSTTLYTCYYDTMNRRTGKQNASVFYNSLYSGWQCMETRDGSGALLTQYIWGQYLDELIRQKNYTAVNGFAANAVLFPMQDMLYRTTGLSDASGVVREAYDTDAYGNTLIFRNAGTPPAAIAFSDSDTQVTVPTCEFIFTGQRYDFETGLYYYKNRYYSPGLGRFLTRDEHGSMQWTKLNNVELYEYASSNPEVRLDSLGEDDEHIDSIAAANAQATARKYITDCCANPGKCDCVKVEFSWGKAYVGTCLMGVNPFSSWAFSYGIGFSTKTTIPFPAMFCQGASPAPFIAAQPSEETPLNPLGARILGHYEVNEGYFTYYYRNMTTSKQAYCNFIHESLHHHYPGTPGTSGYGQHQGAPWDWLECIGCPRGGD